MTALQFAIIAVSAYLLGSLSFAIIVSKMTMGQDIRKFGSGNAGLTNAYRTMGAGKTLLVLLGDVAKGAAAVAIGALVAGPLGKLVAGIFVILGHVFPLFFGFRGGKGVLVGAIMLLLFDWRIFLIALVVFMFAVLLTRWVSLGSVLGAATFPVTMLIFYRDPMLTGIAFGMAVAVILMHRANIMRMLRGEESRFSFKRQKQDDNIVVVQDAVVVEEDAPQQGADNAAMPPSVSTDNVKPKGDTQA